MSLSYGLLLFSVLILTEVYNSIAFFKQFQLAGITLYALTYCFPSFFLSIETPPLCLCLSAFWFAARLKAVAQSLSNFFELQS